MGSWLGEAWRAVTLHGGWLAAVFCMAMVMGIQWCRALVLAGQRQREIWAREELEAYARMDVRLPPDGDVRELGRSVCRGVVDKSAFRRVALLVRDTAGRMHVAASAGMDEPTVASWNGWGLQAGQSGGAGLGLRIGEKSFAVVLGTDTTEIGSGRAIVVPLWTSGGRMAGALALGAERMMSVPRTVLEAALPSLEILSGRLGRALESAEMAERLLQAEKLAGLGMMAGGVAHALNNPLTAVLGFAELIVETAQGDRIKGDAEMIVREALRMRQTVESLQSFWPSNNVRDTVALGPLLAELAAACADELASRGVQLTVLGEETGPVVCGDRNRLRQVVEHLLNNAAEAVASTAQEEHEIRLALSHDERRVHLIVSDTGPGFRDPGRVFDPFYTGREPGEGAGLGLSICYGIVREHGGEISALNLHPRGAAVIVELPVMEASSRSAEDQVRIVA
jgi:signal transduction histidine kinase